MLIKYCFKYYDGSKWRYWSGCFCWNSENGEGEMPAFLKNMGEACPFFNGESEKA